MKKIYESPIAETVSLQGCASLCAVSLPVGRDDQSGTEQLSQKFWGSSMFDDVDPDQADEAPLL